MEEDESKVIGSKVKCSNKEVTKVAFSGTIVRSLGMYKLTAGKRERNNKQVMHKKKRRSSTVYDLS